MPSIAREPCAVVSGSSDLPAPGGHHGGRPGRLDGLGSFDGVGRFGELGGAHREVGVDELDEALSAEAWLVSRVRDPNG